MQNTLIQVSTGKRISLTPNCDGVFIDPAGRGSVEYAKARTAIDADYRINFAMNQPLAKNKRRESKTAIINVLGGKVSSKMVEDKKDPTKKRKQFIITFNDGSIANL
jgi:hypothetical protein